jgi:hypothetical protein
MRHDHSHAPPMTTIVFPVKLHNNYIPCLAHSHVLGPNLAPPPHNVAKLCYLFISSTPISPWKDIMGNLGRKKICICMHVGQFPSTSDTFSATLIFSMEKFAICSECQLKTEKTREKHARFYQLSVLEEGLNHWMWFIVRFSISSF